MDVLWKENNYLYNVLCVLITENEKLFDRSDARLYWTTVFHMLTVLHHGYAARCGAELNMDIELPEIIKLKKYRVAYLTGWNFISIKFGELVKLLLLIMSFQTTFLCLALVHDLLQWLDKHESNLGKKIKYFRDIIFNGLVFPFTCFVTGMFWTIYLIDRELVFPQVYDQIVPWWLNHCVHTNIFIVIAIETILTRRRHPTDVKVERYMYGFVSVFYAVVYYSIFFFGGVWLYGVFGVMTWWQVCIYQSCIWFSTWVFYRMAFIINRLIHKEEDVTVAHKDSKAANGDFESKETTFNGSKNGSNIKNGAPSEVAHDFNKSGYNVEKTETKGEKEVNGDDVNGKTNDLSSDNGNLENGKEWKSLGANVINEESENGTQDQPFDKSWSTKYRTNRNQIEKSSL